MALYFADLHLHSKYSRAVSQKMDLEHLQEGAKKKGLQILGSGDFSHPKWFAELKGKLDETSEGSGFYYLKGEKIPQVLFLLQNEISTIISTPKGVKKVHHILFAPNFEVLEQLNDRLAKMGSLISDGRPVFGSCSPANLVEICKEVSREIEIIPAHVWTPWFAIFGSNSGFNSIEEGYGDQAKHIFAYETGMSSDPAMNWQVSKLDKYVQISNSDSHSPYPYRIGRECNVFEFEENDLKYEKFFGVLRNKDKKHFKFTVEVDPNYGKYHFDGHRNCGFSCAPDETKKLNGICPKCKGKLTIGVMSRVEELSDRAEGVIPKEAIPYKTLLPLQELIAGSVGSPMMSRKVYLETERLLKRFGNEFEILLNATEKEIRTEVHESLSKAIIANRGGKLKVKAGYDGEYGVLQLPESMQISRVVRKKSDKTQNHKTQTDLTDFS